jgi:hypothetical protein
MTQDELNALRDVSPSFGQIERIIDGKRVIIPTLSEQAGALFQKPEDGVVQDAAGTWWMTGWLKGEHVRRRVG